MSFGDALIAPTVAVHQDNYNPVGLQETIVLDISSSSAVNFTGIMAPDPDGTRVLYVFNVGTKNITFKDNDAGSDAENRILLGANKTVQPDEGLILVYDNAPSVLRWRVPAINI